MAALFAFGSAAYAYDRYGVQDNNMILANVEAFAQDADGDDDGDGGGNITYDKVEKDCSYPTGTYGPRNSIGSVNSEGHSNAILAYNGGGVGHVILPKEKVECFVEGVFYSCTPKLCPTSVKFTIGENSDKDTKKKH